MNIVFFGDSITEGCFEIVRINGKLEVLRDVPNGYASLTAKALKSAFPDRKIDCFNAGISGNSSEQGLRRIETDVFAKNPDLVILCFGLNDVYYRDAEKFSLNMQKMFAMLKEKNIETIYMSPNMMNTYVGKDVPIELLATAEDCAACQNDGVLKEYIEKTEKIAQKYGVYFVNVYAYWEKLSALGVDTTALLCNHINHPKREMHTLFCEKLIECIKTNNLIG